MYQDHVSILNAGMRADPDTFARGVTFAFLSVRQQFPRVCAALSAVAHAGTNARDLWGWKRGSYDFLRKNKFALWEYMAHSQDSEAAIVRISTIPGMGIVKSAFVCQMMGHDIGCLDTRNIARLRLNPREYRSDGEARKHGKAFDYKVHRYVQATMGQAETLWNAWCEDVAKVYGTSAEEISRDHLCIVPRAILRAGLDVKPVPCIVRSDVPF